MNIPGRTGSKVRLRRTAIAVPAARAGFVRSVAVACLLVAGLAACGARTGIEAPSPTSQVDILSAVGPFDAADAANASDVRDVAEVPRDANTCPPPLRPRGVVFTRGRFRVGDNIAAAADGSVIAVIDVSAADVVGGIAFERSDQGLVRVHQDGRVEVIRRFPVLMGRPFPGGVVSALGLDRSGNLLVVGAAHGDLGDGILRNGTVFVASYTAEGALRWVHVLTHPVRLPFYMGRCAVDTSGNVLLSAVTDGPVEWDGERADSRFVFGPNMLVALVSPDGQLRWMRSVASGHPWITYAVLTNDAADFLIVGNYRSASDTHRIEVMVESGVFRVESGLPRVHVRISPDGRVLSARAYGEHENVHMSVAHADGGDVWVASHAFNRSTALDFGTGRIGRVPAFIARLPEGGASPLTRIVTGDINSPSGGGLPFLSSSRDAVAMLTRFSNGGTADFGFGSVSFDEPEPSILALYDTALNPCQTLITGTNDGPFAMTSFGEHGLVVATRYSGDFPCGPGHDVCVHSTVLGRSPPDNSPEVHTAFAWLEP